MVMLGRARYRAPLKLQIGTLSLEFPIAVLLRDAIEPLLQALSALRVTEGNALVKILNLNLLNPEVRDAL